MSVCLSVSNSERPLSLIVRLWKDFLFFEGSRSVMSLQSSCWPGLQFRVKSRLGKNLLPSLTMWLSGLSSSWAGGQRSSVSHWLLGKSLPQCLATWASLESHNVAADFPQGERESRRKHPRRKSWYLATWYQN